MSVINEINQIRVGEDGEYYKLRDDTARTGLTEKLDSSTSKINGKSLVGGATLTKNDIGLGNVENYACDYQPIEHHSNFYVSSGGVYNAMLSKVPNERKVNGHPLTSDVKVTATDVGLGNVDNESKATMFNSAALTGTPTAPTASKGTNTTQIATTAFVNSALSSIATYTSSTETLNILPV